MTFDDIQEFSVNPYLYADQCYFTMSLDADFSKLFDWNTKLLFVYLTASYNNTAYQRNEVIIWDHIVTKDKPVVKLNKKPHKYFFRDIGRNLKGQGATFTLNYNFMPHVGFLSTHQIFQSSLTLPEQYFKKKEVA